MQRRGTAAAAAAELEGSVAHVDGKPSTPVPSVWLVDSAASHHVTGDKALLRDLQPANVVITDVGGSRHRAGEQVTAELLVLRDAGTRQLSVPGVLYVPELLSVAMLLSRVSGCSWTTRCAQWRPVTQLWSLCHASSACMLFRPCQWCSRHCSSSTGSAWWGWCRPPVAQPPGSHGLRQCRSSQQHGQKH
jgi:hypothetical protein